MQLSETACCVFFKREVGKTFVNYTNEYRLEMACAQLKNHPDEKTSAIAEQCGFLDINYFNRYFKKQKGKSPREWKLAN